MMIPDMILLTEEDEKNVPKIVTLIDEYEKRFGKTWSTEGMYFSDEELEQIFQTCLDENRKFYDVAGMDMENIGENVKI